MTRELAVVFDHACCRKELMCEGMDWASEESFTVGLCETSDKNIIERSRVRPASVRHACACESTDKNCKEWSTIEHPTGLQ